MQNKRKLFFLTEKQKKGGNKLRRLNRVRGKKPMFNLKGTSVNKSAYLKKMTSVF
jgi:hypothetical protein